MLLIYNRNNFMMNYDAQNKIIHHNTFSCCCGLLHYLLRLGYAEKNHDTVPARIVGNIH